MQTTGKELGNPRVASSVAVGALIRLLDLPEEALRDIFEKALRPQYVDINMEAAKVGFNAVSLEQGEAARKKANSRANGNGELIPEAERRDYSEWIMINANQAIALGALAAGMQFYSAYPMSPSTSIMEYLAGIQNEANIVVEQAEDELAAMNAVVGASYAGAVSMVGTSGGGYQLMVEAMSSAGMMEIPACSYCDATRAGYRFTRVQNRAILNWRYLPAMANIEDGLGGGQEDAFIKQLAPMHRAKYQIPVVVLTDNISRTERPPSSLLICLEWKR